MRIQSMIVIVAVLIASVHRSQSELFTAVVEMERLVQTERRLLLTLEQYIDSEQTRIDKLRRLRTRFRSISEAADADTIAFLGNPISSFQLVRSLTSDWNEGNIQTIHVCCNRSKLINKPK
jgi:prolyl 4-hydroxylase